MLVRCDASINYRPADARDSIESGPQTTDCVSGIPFDWKSDDKMHTTKF